MFLSVANCTVAYECVDPEEQIYQSRAIHKAALFADVILGIALLIIGICANQFGFLPISVQYAFIGAGAAYSIGIFSFIAQMIKGIVAPGRFCC